MEIILMVHGTSFGFQILVELLYTSNITIRDAMVNGSSK